MRAVAGGGAIGSGYIGYQLANILARFTGQRAASGIATKFQQHRASTTTKRRESIRYNRGGLPSGEAAAYTLHRPSPSPLLDRM